jgi:hypothetical protein
MPNLLHCSDELRSNHLHPPQQRQQSASVAIGVATTSLALKSVFLSYPLTSRDPANPQNPAGPAVQPGSDARSMMKADVAAHQAKHMYSMIRTICNQRAQLPQAGAPLREMPPLAL